MYRGFFPHSLQNSFLPYYNNTSKMSPLKRAALLKEQKLSEPLGLVCGQVEHHQSCGRQHTQGYDQLQCPERL